MKEREREAERETDKTRKSQRTIFNAGKSGPIAGVKNNRKTEKRFNIISYLFEESLLMKFPLIIKVENLLFVFIFSFFILIFSALYPSIKASKLNIINSLGYRR